MKKITEYQLRTIQIQILNCVDDYCKKHDIKYFLTGGTLIGAIRHNGYIPWDDDIDIMMYRDEYCKFIESFNKDQDEYHAFSLIDRGYNYPFCKICDKHTLLLEDNIKIHDAEMGVFIDLFPLDKLPENTDENTVLKKLHKLDWIMYGKSYICSRLSQKTVVQRLSILLGKFVGIIIPKKRIAYLQDKISQQYKDSNTHRYGLITSAIRSKIPTIHRDITQTQKHIFENREYNIPSTYDNYLREQYGDYMKLPPQNEQKSNHSFTVWRKE